MLAMIHLGSAERLECKFARLVEGFKWSFAASGRSAVAARRAYQRVR